MRHETRFRPRHPLIVVDARVSGPRGTIPLQLALDTAATITTISPDILDEIGYSARDGDKITNVTSAIGEERGFRLFVASFSALGFSFDNFKIHAFDLTDRHGIDGLIGLNFLENLNYEIRSAEGRILAELIEP